jgi:hypothetical protein
MVKAHIERVVDVPIDRAWEILSDYSNGAAMLLFTLS